MRERESFEVTHVLYMIGFLEQAGFKDTYGGDSTVTIDRITISSPEGINGVFREVKLGRPKIFDKDVSSSALVDAFIGKMSERQLDPGEDQHPKFKFASKLAKDQSAYSIQVDFAEGCSLNF